MSLLEDRTTLIVIGLIGHTLICLGLGYLFRGPPRRRLRRAYRDGYRDGYHARGISSLHEGEEMITPSGRVVTDAEAEQWVVEAEQGYDTDDETMLTARCGVTDDAWGRCTAPAGHPPGLHRWRPA